MENRKVYLDNHTNLLQLEEHMYPLVDVKTPNVFRNLFHYDEIPKIAFNDRIVPHCMPDEIWITDTTFRDGQQSRAPYSTEQIVTLYDYFHRLGGPKGKIRQCEFFLYSKKDRDAVYKCMERDYKFPEVTSWIRASKKDFQLVKEIGMKETGILVSCSDYHIFYKLINFYFLISLSFSKSCFIDILLFKSPIKKLFSEYSICNNNLGV